MRIFKYRMFCQWAKSERLNDTILLRGVDEMMLGLFDAYLGGSLYKKRVARKGQGKRGGYRTILAFKQNDRIIFMYGFAKNQRENISSREADIYKKLAKYYLEIADSKINIMVDSGELFEVAYEKKSEK
jgi:hypothetical protein